tara:strand:- start:2661 stop:3146 length:486 start_codon:yes stop_codon:yes gene_type:complete
MGVARSLIFGPQARVFALVHVDPEKEVGTRDSPIGHILVIVRGQGLYQFSIKEKAPVGDMAKLLTVRGTVSTAPPDAGFVEMYSKVYLKISREHLFPVRLGVTNEQWSVRPFPDAPRPPQIEYSEFFDLGDDDWNLEQTVLLGEAEVVALNGRSMGSPKSV